jgi:hypothetical protein
MDKKDLINKFKKVLLDPKKCKSSQRLEPALICRNKEKKAHKDSTWKKEEVEMLQTAIAKIEKNELDVYIDETRKNYNKSIQALKEGRGNTTMTVNYILDTYQLLDIPSFMQFVTVKMVNRDYIKKYKNPIQRYNVIIQKENILELNTVPAKLNVLRLTLNCYKRDANPKMETVYNRLTSKTF